MPANFKGDLRAVASGLSIATTGALRPAHRETIFCKTLVVGNTIAAYTATLAILQAGEQVCWASAGPLDVFTELTQAQLDAQSTSKFSWRVGKRVSSWETVTVMSQSQQAFWDNWRAPQNRSKTASSSQLQAIEPSQDAPPISKDTQLRQAIAPYIESQKLILIPQGVPVRVLYAEKRGWKRVYQVVFQDKSTKRRFQIQAKLTLDATRNAALQQYFQGVRGELATTEVMLTTDHLAMQSGYARGTFFADAIALAMTPVFKKSGRAKPLSIPLRSLIPKKTEGFLCISFPGCEKALRPIFRQARARWMLGEASGHIAAKAAQAGGIWRIMQGRQWQWHLQRYLVQQGIPIFAFDDVSLDDPDFEAIQMVAIANIVRTMRRRDLRFRPETPVTKAVLASVLTRLPAANPLPPSSHTQGFQDVSNNHWAMEAIEAAIASQQLTADSSTTFAPSKVLTKSQLWQVLQPLSPSDIKIAPFPLDDTPARRRHLSRALYPIVRIRLEKS